MKIFNSKRTHQQTLEAELAALKSRATLLNGKRAACSASLDDAKARGQQHLLFGDLDEEEIGLELQGLATAAQSALTGLDVASAVLTVSITQTEQALTAEVQRVKCEADAAALTAVIAGLEKRFGSWLEATRAIAASLEEVNGFRYQAAGLAGFYRHIAGEGEIALRVVLDDLRGAVAGVADGSQPIQIGRTLPAPAVATPPAIPPKDITYTTQGHGPTYRVPAAFAREK